MGINKTIIVNNILIAVNLSTTILYVFFIKLYDDWLCRVTGYIEKVLRKQACLP